MTGRGCAVVACRVHTEQMSTSGEGKPRVLIVDDDEGIRQALRDLLTEEGIEVVGEASDGQQAITVAAELKPDVLLMDLRMPVLGGSEATAAIRADRAETQVIILSAYDDPALSDGATEAGAFAYLIKGCSASLVRDTLLEAYEVSRPA